MNSVEITVRGVVMTVYYATGTAFVEGIYIDGNDDCYPLFKDAPVMIEIMDAMIKEIQIERNAIAESLAEMNDTLALDNMSRAADMNAER